MDHGSLALAGGGVVERDLEVAGDTLISYELVLELVFVRLLELIDERDAVLVVSSSSAVLHLEEELGVGGVTLDLWHRIHFGF